MRKENVRSLKRCRLKQHTFNWHVNRRSDNKLQHHSAVEARPSISKSPSQQPSGFESLNVSLTRSVSFALGVLSTIQYVCRPTSGLRSIQLTTMNRVPRYLGLYFHTLNNNRPHWRIVDLDAVELFVWALAHLEPGSTFPVNAVYYAALSRHVSDCRWSKAMRPSSFVSHYVLKWWSYHAWRFFSPHVKLFEAFVNSFFQVLQFNIVKVISGKSKILWYTSETCAVEPDLQKTTPYVIVPAAYYSLYLCF